MSSRWTLARLTLAASLLLLGTVMLGVAPYLAPASASSLPDPDWPQLGRDPQRTNASPQTVSGPYRYYWRWTEVPMASRAQPVVVAGRLFVGGLDGNLYALDAAYDGRGGVPKVLWKRDLYSPIRAGAAVDGSTVVVGTHHGTIYGVDAASGQPRWSVATSGAILASPLVADGIAYLGSADGLFYAVRTADGAIVWKQQIGVPILGSAALSADGRQLFFVAENVKAYALAADTGAILWQAQLQGQSGSDRWTVVIGGTVVFRTQPLRYFHDLLHDGDDAMDSAGPRLPDWDADWAAVKPRIAQYLAEKPADQTFFALDAATGQSRGTAPILYTYGNNDAPSPPVVSDGKVYVVYRPRHGIQTDSPVVVHVTSRYDAEIGSFDSSTLDVAGLRASEPFGYQFRLTSDEPAILTVAGDLILVDNWERLGGLRPSNGTLVGIAQFAHNALPCTYGLSGNDNLMPFYEACPFLGPETADGVSRSGAIVGAGRIFWRARGSGLAAIGPAGGVSNPRYEITPTPAPAAQAVPAPTQVSTQALASFIWNEPRRPVLATPELRARLEEEIDRIVASDEHLMPFFLERGFHGPGSWPPDVANDDKEPASVGGSRAYWFDPGELVLTLSTAYPYLDGARQAKVRAYLVAEMSRFSPLSDLPWPTDPWLKTGRARESYTVPFRSGLSTWPPPGASIQSIYAVWAYGRYTGDWEYVRAHWGEIQSLFNRRRASINSYAEIGGAIGYARIARQLGYETEASAGESAATAAMQSGYDFVAWRDRANALYRPDPNRPDEKPGRRGQVFFGLTPEVGLYLRETNLAAVERTIDDVTAYPSAGFLWYATRSGTQDEDGESSYRTPEVGWSVYLAHAHVRLARQDQLRRWLDRPWGVGDLWHIQKLVAAIEAPTDAGYSTWIPVVK